MEIIRASQFGIHDISRVELDEVNHLPRFNMPLEFGLFLGAKAYSSEPRQKARRCLILDTEPYRYQKFVSDIAGQDIRAHEGDPRKALILTRNWLATVCKRKFPGTSELERLYACFGSELPAILTNLSLRQEEVQFVEYVNIERRTLPRFTVLCQLGLRQVAKLANARSAFNVEPKRTKRERWAVQAVIFASSVRRWAFNVGCSAFVSSLNAE